MLIIILIGFGIMDKSGFLDSLFYILTKNANKRVVTFILSLICVLASIVGDLSYIVLIPTAALLFKYGKRHPKAGIICAFASMSCGIGINIFMNSIDSSLLSYTTLAASIFTSDYSISVFAYVLIMLIAAVVAALIVSDVTERIIVPRLGHYELMDEKEDYLTKREKRGLILSLGAGIIYLLIFIYNIIPNAPLGGNLLDYSQTLYIDTLLFFILGLTYGFGSKNFKSGKEVWESLSYSLDKIGKVLVLIFFASSFIFIFKKSNIGTLITASLASVISASEFTGLPLILLLFIISALSTLVLPSSISKWAILSASAVPVFMNAGLSPEFATVIFRAGECCSYALTPVMAYFVIYIAFMELYSTDDQEGLFGNIKYLMPYSGFITIMWIVIILAFYLIGLPLGVGAYPGL